METLTIEATKIIFEGHNYLVVLHSSSCFYGRKTVYHILTNNQKWCGSLMPELCGHPNVQSKGEHDINYKRNPSILTALKPYYTVEFKEDDFYEQTLDMEELKKEFDVDGDSYYEFTYIEPYDD